MMEIQLFMHITTPKYPGNVGTPLGNCQNGYGSELSAINKFSASLAAIQGDYMQYSMAFLKTSSSYIALALLISRLFQIHFSSYPFISMAALINNTFKVIFTVCLTGPMANLL